MGYEKNIWSTGDTITAAKLNNIEQGIADGGVLIVNLTYDDQTGDPDGLDKTWQEIHDATIAFTRDEFEISEGVIETTINLITMVSNEERFIVVAGSYTYVCQSPDEYPKVDDGGGHSPIEDAT